MSKSTDLTAKIRFIFEVDATAGIAQLTQAEDGLTSITFGVGEMTNVVNISEAATSSYGSSIRGLLLNLRMFSFAVRTLRREFGNTNPVIEQISVNLITLAALTTGLAAGYDILKKATAAFMASSNALIGTLKIVIGVLGGWQVALIALGLLALPSVIKGVSEWRSGISKLKQEVKDLEFDLKMMETALDRLNLTQERFNLGMSLTALSIMRLKRAIDLQQSGTEALEAQMESMNAELLNQQITNAQLNIQQQEQNLLVKEATELAADYARQIEAVRIAQSLARASRGMVGAGPETQRQIQDALRQIGWTEGPVDRRRLLGLMREQNPAGIGRGGGGTNVNINFPNALFQTAEGVREAIIEGARQAADIIRFNQYAEPGAQR